MHGVTFHLTKICFAILGRVIVVPNTNHRSEEGVGVIKSLENLFFGDSAKNEVEESPAGYYDENGYYQRKSNLFICIPCNHIIACFTGGTAGGADTQWSPPSNPPCPPPQ